jgi:asparagine synthase (glutamine-hydrolysing)
MCGIFGILQADPIDPQEVSRMSTLLRHRGPDDEGFLFWGSGPAIRGGADTPQEVLDSSLPYTPRQRLDSRQAAISGVALGHRRLAILDLSPRGHQPMSRVEGNWLVYNGEVYNFVELRRELETLGYRFTTSTDTEVILAAYDQWGIECFSRLNGMWALALLDTARRQLVIARDRFGVKPLYVSLTPSRIAFASEIKAFQGLTRQMWRANERRLLDFLVWNVSDHTSETMFDGIEQLPAGHLAIINLVGAGSGNFDAQTAYVPQRWYSLRDRISSGQSETPNTLRDLLDDAVRLRLRADVPVGSCLSGGLDSSAIVCLLARQLRDHAALDMLRTFTANSADKAFDESDYARAVVESTGARAHVVTPLPDDLFSSLDQLTWHQDEPFLTSSIFAQWCVFRLAHEHGVVVMLDGQGADEILCGYRGYFGAYLASLLTAGRVPQWVRESTAIKRQVGFGYSRLIGYSMAYAMPRLVRVLGRFDARPYGDVSWIRSRHRSVFREDPLREAGGRARSIRAMSVAQITKTHLPMLLHWEDRNSMAFSIEARVPFLDYRVVEFCLGLSDESKIGRGISKRALRAGMRGIVPDTILNRRDKMGFVTAEPMWVTRDSAPRFRAELAAAVEAFEHVLDPSTMKSYDDVVAGRRPFDFRYWRAMSAGRWARRLSLAAL